MHSFRIFVLGFLLVSFRPALLRSRSCSTGDPLLVFPPGPVPDFRILSSASVLASHYSASVSSFPLSSRFRLTVASPVRPLRSRFLGFPLSPPPGFPCFLSRFSYSASCSFPFILPGFAPTAVPPVLPFFSAFASLPGFPLAFCFLSSASARF